MKTATMYELRDNLSTYISDIVDNNSTIIIYRYNKPVAKLVHVGKDFKPSSWKSFCGFMGSAGKRGIVFEDKVRRNTSEKARVAKLKNRS